MPVAAALGVYYLGSFFGLDTLDAGTLMGAVLASPLAIPTACLTGVGEGDRVERLPLAPAARPAVVMATGFAVTTKEGEKLAAFTGSTARVGEFGWLAALAVGVVASVWHLRHPPHRSEA